MVNFTLRYSAWNLKRRDISKKLKKAEEAARLEREKEFE